MPPTPRISASSYSNTAPLIWSFLYGTNRGKFELILDNAPARSAELLAQNRIDAALVPVIEYQRIPDVFLVPEVCVGARERVRSVCLVTKGEELRDVRSVALDISSKTSVALTKIIFREFLNLEPVYKPAKPNLSEMLSDSDCALLIGDPALMISDSGFGIADLAEDRLRKFDLAETWREFTGFGFVFAMWMANRDKAETARRIDFPAARDEGLAHLDEIIANYESEITLPREDFKKYLSENISYTIDDSMRQGLELYHKLAYQNGLCENNAALRFLEPTD
jgi:chorismate dehydratase